MTYITNREFGMEVRQGKASAFSALNKFGFALDCDQNTATDIWDGADGTTSTDVWVAPTTARTHDIVSTSVNDIALGGGNSGCRTIEVYGLTNWDTAETSETVTMNGTSNVATSSSYVIIHRMVCRTFGSGGTNAGIITATAQTDGTVTAAVQAGEGQTLMAIYGVPSTQNIYLKHIHASILRGVSASGDLTLLVKEDADLATAGFITKDRFTFENASPIDRLYWVPKKFNGPCILKLQVSASANNSQVTAGFDGYVVTE